MASSDEDDLLVLLLVRRRRLRNRRRQRRFWVHPILEKRQSKGHYTNLVEELRRHPNKFYNYHRMTVEQFDRLLVKVKPLISKQNVYRVSISAGLRLSLTLRFLASGDLMKSLAYNYRVGESTVSGIIAETCTAIWDVLNEEVIPKPTKDNWKNIADDFGKKWNFPNCTGAIDGKHVLVKCFDNSGSTCFNYKATYSIVLLGICDANYRFTFVSIGSAGREGDAGIFKDTAFANDLTEGNLPLPSPKTLRGRPDTLFPAVFLGDAAFPLKPNLMTPYPGKNLTPEQIIFNYRLSRPRRVIENTFGIISNRYMVFRKPIQASYSTVVDIVKACVCLHNLHLITESQLPVAERSYLQPQYVDAEDNEGNIVEGQWRREPQAAGLEPLPRARQRNPRHDAKTIRNTFSEHFMREGHVPWQWNKLPHFVRDRYRHEALRAAFEAGVLHEPPE